MKWKWQCSKRNGPCFSCVSIELWMHLGSCENTREAREALRASPRVTQTLLSCSPNFPRASTHHFLSGCTQEVGRAREKRLSASLASRVLPQLPKCIHSWVDAQLKHVPFLLEHCHKNTRKVINCRILLNRSERFHWLNAGI